MGNTKLMAGLESLPKQQMERGTSLIMTCAAWPASLLQKPVQLAKDP
jgi:hypothetical protein